MGLEIYGNNVNHYHQKHGPEQQGIQQKKNIPNKKQVLLSWANDFRLLHEYDKISLIRIRKALIWYGTNFDLPFVPIVLSGKSFRSKFLNIEAAIKRGKQTNRNFHTDNHRRDFKYDRSL